MLFGIYTHKKMLLVDSDYFIEMDNVFQVICELANVTYEKKPSLEDLKTNNHNQKMKKKIIILILATTGLFLFNQGSILTRSS